MLRIIANQKLYDAIKEGISQTDTCMCEVGVLCTFNMGLGECELFAEKLKPGPNGEELNHPRLEICKSIFQDLSGELINGKAI